MLNGMPRSTTRESRPGRQNTSPCATLLSKNLPCWKHVGIVLRYVAYLLLQNTQPGLDNPFCSLCHHLFQGLCHNMTLTSHLHMSNTAAGWEA